MRLDIMPYVPGPYTKAWRPRGLAGLGCSTCSGQSRFGCAGCPKRSQGLGEWEALVGAALSAYSASQKGDGSGGQGQIPQSQASTNVVTPTIVTSVSPQISPTFQQSYMPQNSAMSAGTSQGTPNVAMPALGIGDNNLPGYPIQQPYAQPMAAVAAAPSSQLISGIDNTTLAIVGVLGLAWYMQSGSGGKKKKHGKAAS